MEYDVKCHVESLFREEVEEGLGLGRGKRGRMGGGCGLTWQGKADLVSGLQLPRLPTTSLTVPLSMPTALPSTYDISQPLPSPHSLHSWEGYMLSLASCSTNCK